MRLHMSAFRRYVQHLFTLFEELTEQVGEAYQVLSDEGLRKRYDQFGKEDAVPGGGFGG